MNGIEKILERIQGDAQGAADQVIEKAQREAEEILTRYGAQARREETEILARGEKTAAERVERLDGAARMEAKKQMLAARQEMVEKTFQLAKNKLMQLAEEDYVSLLAGLAAGASFSGREKIVLSKQDRQTVGEKVTAAANARLLKEGKTAELSLAAETQELGGGLLLMDGMIEVNCSFETLLRLGRGQFSTEVAAVLFN